MGAEVSLECDAVSFVPDVSKHHGTFFVRIQQSKKRYALRAVETSETNHCLPNSTMSQATVTESSATDCLVSPHPPSYSMYPYYRLFPPRHLLPNRSAEHYRVNSVTCSQSVRPPCKSRRVKRKTQDIFTRVVRRSFVIFQHSTRSIEGRGSSVGIATRYRLDGLGIESRRELDFSPFSRPALGPTQLPVSSLFPGGKAAGAWH